MTWGAVGVAGVSLLGGIMGSKASKKAGETQAEAGRYAADTSLKATRESNALVNQMYQQGLVNQTPYMQGGQQAFSALLGGMGLQAPRGYGGATGTGGPTGTYTNASGQPVDAQGNVITQTGGLQNYGASQAEMDAAARGQQDASGVGNFTKTFAPSDLTTDPSYKWRLEQGLRAMKGEQSGKGLLGSSASMTGLNNYAQGAASQEYQSAYDRFMNNQNTAYNRLAGLAGIGQTTGTNMANQGANAASTIGANTMAGTGSANNFLTGAAASSAAGGIGSANALAGGLSGAANNWMGYQYLNGKGSGIQKPGSGIQQFDDVNQDFGGWTGGH